MKYLIPVFVALFILSAFAAPGDLDPTFGVGGRVTTAPGPSSDRARGVAMQSDGKIVVAGWSEGGSTGPRMFVIRYNADGSLDPSFGSGGIVSESSDSRGWAVAVQPDGKIVVGGTYFTGINRDTCVWRFNPDGTADTTFNGTGRRVITISFFYPDEIYGIALQSDGKILAVGTARDDNNPDNDFLTLRYHPDGSSDTSWDTDGIGITPMDAVNDAAWGLAIQPDGRAAVVGEGGTTTTVFTLAVARFNADGSLDASFDGDGKLLRSFTGSAFAYDVKLQPDGKIVVGGNVAGSLSILRFNADGSTDLSFNGNGRSDYGFTDSAARAIAIQTDGKIVGIGHGYAGSYRFFAIARVNTDGTRDAAFGNGDGFVTTDFGPSTFAFAEDGLIQPDGKILAVGFVNGGPYVSHDIAMARYLGPPATSANVAISGRVTTASGSAIPGARITLTDPSGAVTSAYTSAFGYYSFDVAAGSTYVVSVSSKAYTFDPPTRIISVADGVENADFIAVSRK